MKHDPKIYNPKIARLEGIEFKKRRAYLKGAKTEYAWYRGQLEVWLPNYHESPADLLRVLEKIAETSLFEVLGDKGGICVFIGPGREFGARCFDTFKAAAYSAICQWIDRQSNRSENPNSSGGILIDVNDPAKGYREEGGKQ